MAVFQLRLDSEYVYPAFQQVLAKAVAQGVRATALHDARAMARALVGALGRFNARRLRAGVFAKQPGISAIPGANISNKVALADQQGCTWNDVAGVAPFATGHPEALAVVEAVNVAPALRAGLRDAQTRRVHAFQQHSVQRVRAAGDQASYFYAGQQLGIFAGTLAIAMAMGNSLRSRPKIFSYRKRQVQAAWFSMLLGRA